MVRGKFKLANKIKTKTALFLSVLGILAGSSGILGLAIGTASAATLDVCSSGCTYSTIQAAVNAAAPGDTVTVASGTYNEVVSINKDLTLKGAQAGVAGNSHSGAESIVTGFNVSNANVTVDGFQVTSGSANGGTGLLFHGGTVENVQNNVISGYKSEGMAFFGTSGMTFQNNLVKSPAQSSSDQDGIFTGTGVSNGVKVLNNVFDHASTGGTDIGLSYTSGSNPVISGNKSVGGATLVTVFNSTGAQVTDNSFAGDPNLTGSIIYIGGGDSNTTVSGNTASGGFYGVVVRNIFGYGPSTGTTITGNSLTNNYGGGISVGSGSIASTETVVAHDNVLSNNPYGVNNSSTGQVDATCNYWGAANGPGSVGTGSGSGVSTNVSYTPWQVKPHGNCVGGTVPTTLQNCADDGWMGMHMANGKPFKNGGQCVGYVWSHNHTISGYVNYTAYGLQRHAYLLMFTATNRGTFYYSDANHAWYRVSVSDVAVNGHNGYFAGKVTAASNHAWVGNWLFGEAKDGRPDQIWGSFTSQAAAENGVAAMGNPADGPFNITSGHLEVH